MNRDQKMTARKEKKVWPEMTEDRKNTAHVSQGIEKCTERVGLVIEKGTDLVHWG